MPTVISADHKDFRVLNRELKEMLRKDKELILEEVNGQRYIGAGLEEVCHISIKGVPGNDLGIFMEGAFIEVYGNVQDGVANTMSGGKIVVHGSGGDVLGYGMRGGEVYIRDNTGYRTGVHMKEYEDKKPLIVIGGSAGDFLGEYMAGGVIVVLNRENKTYPVGSFCGSGMHGGVIYIRGKVDVMPGNLALPLGESDIGIIKKCLDRYNEFFGCQLDVNELDFIKIVSSGHRPYKELYSGC